MVGRIRELRTDADGKVIDHIWSPLYNLSKAKLPQGKLDSIDRALHHTGDDLTGDQNGDDGLDNEIITVDLSRVNSNVNSIVFFLNIYNNDEYQGDFSGIPYASIRMYEGTPTKVREVFAQYDVATRTDCVGKRALVMGKLYRHNGEWKFAAIGDSFEDRSIVFTIAQRGCTACISRTPYYPYLLKTQGIFSCERNLFAVSICQSILIFNLYYIVCMA